MTMARAINCEECQGNFSGGDMVWFKNSTGTYAYHPQCFVQAVSHSNVATMPEAWTEKILDVMRGARPLLRSGYNQADFDAVAAFDDLLKELEEAATA